MAFTYDGTLDTDLEKVRLEIGDTDSTTALFTDAEVQVKLDSEGSVPLAAAALCDILATRFARDFDFTSDGQSFSRGQRSAMYAARARELRRQAQGVSVDPTTRVDGYSDDIDYSEASTANSSRGRVRAGYFDPDLPY